MADYQNFYHDKYGYCYYLIEENKKPIIFNLYIEPEHRRKGHARKHLQFVIGKIREAGYLGKIQIETMPREDSIDVGKLSALYESMGLEIINRRLELEPRRNR